MPSLDEKLSVYLPKVSLSQKSVDTYVNFMFLVALVGFIPLAIQCYRIYSTSECKGVSKYAFVFQILLSLSWVGYGFITRRVAVVISSSLIATAALVLVFLVHKYEGEER